MVSAAGAALEESPADFLPRDALAGGAAGNCCSSTASVTVSGAGGTVAPSRLFLYKIIKKKEISNQCFQF